MDIKQNIKNNGVPKTEGELASTEYHSRKR